ncbi:MAG: hypothetical protein NC221_08650 [Duncaniella sp.]|nr:hypothetical protein [Duncaniella sp.]
MKRILTIFFAVACCLLTQAKHMEFMGIPINGTISSFQAKLQAKGCSVSKYSKDLPSGVRMLTGVFAGEDCNIYVWYNNKTKQVYRVRAVKDCEESLQTAHNTFYYFKNLLKQKYSDCALSSDDLEGLTSTDYEFELMVVEEQGDDVMLRGTIDVEIIEYDTYPSQYGVSITYEDFDNTSKNEQKTLEDL